MVADIGTPNGGIETRRDSTLGARIGVAHVLMIPYPSQPHILPMLDLARQLVDHAGGSVTVTFVSFQVLIDRLNKNGAEAALQNSRGAIQLVGVPDDIPPDSYLPSDLPQKPIVLRLSLQVKYNIESFVERLLQDHDPEDLAHRRPTFLLTDVIHWWSTAFAAKLKVLRYVLCCNPACSTLAILKVPAKGYEDVDGTGVLLLDNRLPPLLSKNIPVSWWKSNVLSLPFLSRFPNSVKEAEGIMVNSCLELESEVINALQTTLPGVPVLAVGPLGQSPASLGKNVSMEGLQLSNEAWLTNWLDQQPACSVLYVSFATTGMLRMTKSHVHELAKGLEASKQRFLWVLRAPPDVVDEKDLLPAGFEEKVVQEGRGLLVRGWAPQLKILEHPSTGGFLSSCGWNSTIESLARGVPIISWPSYADQPAISGYAVAVLRVAVELPLEKNWFARAEEIEKAVRMVLLSKEGTAMRERAGEYRISLAAALAPGGSAAQQLQQFAALVLKGTG